MSKKRKRKTHTKTSPGRLYWNRLYPGINRDKWLVSMELFFLLIPTVRVAKLAKHKNHV